MPKFSTHVALMDPDYRAVTFGPGDEVPEWAIDQVGDHVLEAEEVADPDTADDADESNQDQDDDAGTGGEDNDPPPADDQPDFTAPAPVRRRGRAQK